jgi:hypothetical protein
MRSGPALRRAKHPQSKDQNCQFIAHLPPPCLWQPTPKASGQQAKPHGYSIAAAIAISVPVSRCTYLCAVLSHGDKMLRRVSHQIALSGRSPKLAAFVAQALAYARAFGTQIGPPDRFVRLRRSCLTPLDLLTRCARRSSSSRSPKLAAQHPDLWEYPHLSSPSLALAVARARRG